MQAQDIQTPKISLPAIKFICKTVSTYQEKAHTLIIAQCFIALDDT